MPTRRRTSRRRSGLPGGCGGRILIALVLAAFAIGSYYFGTETVDNPYTGETQRLALNTEEEIMMGLQAAPQMAQQHGGLYPDEELAAVYRRHLPAPHQQHGGA